MGGKSRSTRRPRRGVRRAALGKSTEFSQERARRTHESLVLAAARLFGERGYDGVGSPDIARAAKVSVGSFYRYFNDKKAVYLEVVRRLTQRAFDDSMAGLAPERFVGATRRYTISMAIDVFFAHAERNTGLWRSFLAMSMRDPEVAAIQQQVETESLRRMAALVASATTRDRVPNPQATALILYATCNQCACYSAGIIGSRDLDSPSLRKPLADFIEHALFPDAEG